MRPEYLYYFASDIVLCGLGAAHFACTIVLLIRWAILRSARSRNGALQSDTHKHAPVQYPKSFKVLAYIVIGGYLLVIIPAIVWAVALALHASNPLMPSIIAAVIGFIGFAISNNAGHAIVSGGAIRYRLYTRWRVPASDIVKMVTFSGFTYLVACFALVILGYVCSPDHVLSSVSSPYINWSIIISSVIGLLFYFWGCTFYKKPIIIKEVEFDTPSVKMATAQVIIGSIDILMASLVLYFVMDSYVDIPFFTFMGAFIIAQVLGVYSQVPGGLGVFEVVFTNLLPEDENQATLFAILILYRIIYYLLPLILSGVALFIYEFHLAENKKQFLRIKKSKKTLTS